MMRTGPGGRLWVLGGALIAATLLAIGWFVFISPQNARTDSLHAEAATVRARATTFQRRLVELREQNSDLPLYQARLESDRQALPTTSDLSDFLRGLQTISDNTGVPVTALTVGAPTQVTAAGTRVYALPISLTVKGASANVDRFLDRLQQGQARAVLIGSAEFEAGDKGKPLDHGVGLTLHFQVFFAPPAGALTSPAAPASPTAN